MNSGDEEAWAAVRQAYEDSNQPIGQICTTYNVTRGQLMYRRKRDNWRARPERRVRPERRARPGRSVQRTSKSEHLPPMSAQLKDPQQFAMMVGQIMDRLFRITEKELSIIEERMEMGEIRSPADSARDTSSIGSLIKNLEKLTEFNEQFTGGADKRGSVAGVTADEADRIRRDLAQRIERLIKG